MSFVTRLPRLLPALSAKHLDRRSASSLLRVQDVLLPLDNSCRLSDDAVTSTRAAVKAPALPVPGNAFLEDLSEEYEDEGERTKRLGVNDAVHASHVIAKLVEKGDFEAALAARDEFKSMNLPIEPAVSYVKLAIEALSITDSRKRSESFFDWLSLVPLAGHSEIIFQLAEHLMRHPFDFPLLMRFCLISVREGTSADLEKTNILHHIFRYGGPKATTAFLIQLESIVKAQGKSSEEVMVFRNLAIRMHCVDGRIEHALRTHELAEVIEESTQRAIDRLKSSSNGASTSETLALPPSTHSRKTRTKSDPPSPRELVEKLSFLRQAIKSQRPSGLESYLADFMFEYAVLSDRTRAIYALRRKVLKSATLSVRSRWLSGEMLFYSSQGYPLAILRTFLYYFLADNTILSEVQRIFKRYDIQGDRPYRIWTLDWLHARSVEPVASYEKLWPNRLAMSLVWKAIIQLSDVDDLERLYKLFLSQLGLKKELDLHSPSSNNADSALTMSIPEDEKINYAEPESAACPTTLPIAFADPIYFHNFIVAMSTRISPKRGAEVLADMQRLGLAPTVDDWGSLAGAYARSGDRRRVDLVLAHVDKMFMERRESDSSPERIEWMRTRMLVMHNSIIRGFTECGRYREARAIQQRMQTLGFFENGVDRRTRAILHRLSRYEKGYFDDELAKRRSVSFWKEPVYIAKDRVQWLSEPHYPRKTRK